MRILFLSHCLPYPPDKGDRIRAYHEIKQLAESHSIHLLALAPEPQRKHRAALLELCESVEVFPLNPRIASLRSLIGIAGRRPLTLRYFWSAELARRVRELVDEEPFDIVLAYTSAMVQYAMLVDDTPRVLDMVDVDSAKWSQYGQYASFPRHLIYHLEARKMRAYEASLGGEFRRILLTTRREADLLAAHGAGIRAVTVRNGICQETFRRFDLPRAESPTLLFTGQMDYFANTDAVCFFGERVFPGLRQQYPEMEFLIVGRSPTPGVKALEREPGITVTGAVADVRPFLARATIFVAPLRIAQGVQNKVLEAMAAELPVVCTPAVLAGIADSGFRDGEHLLVADDEAGFHRMVARLIDDRPLRDRLVVAAREQLSRAHTWSRNMGEVEAILRATVAESHDRVGDRRERPADARIA